MHCALNFKKEEVLMRMPLSGFLMYQELVMSQNLNNSLRGLFSYGRFFSDRTIISKPLDPSLDPEDRNEILDSRRSLVEKVKKNTDVELHPTKVNVIDPKKKKKKCKPPPTLDEILLKLDISKDDYYHGLSISLDDDYELHLI